MVPALLKAPGTFGGLPSRVASGTVSDPAARTRHEVDVAVFGRRDDGGERLLAIGEAKWQEPLGLGHLRRLEQIRDLLNSRAGYRGTEEVRLLCFGGAGFSGELRKVAERDASVQLVGLDRLYGGE